MSELSNYLSDEYDDYNYELEDENEDSEGPDLVNSNDLMHNSVPSFKKLLNISLACKLNTIFANNFKSLLSHFLVHRHTKHIACRLQLKCFR